jgi:hypothetical protein
MTWDDDERGEEHHPIRSILACLAALGALTFALASWVFL